MAKDLWNNETVARHGRNWTWLLCPATLTVKCCQFPHHFGSSSYPAISAPWHLNTIFQRQSTASL